MKIKPEDDIGNDIIKLEENTNLSSNNNQNISNKTNALGNMLNIMSIMRQHIPNFIFSIHLLLYTNIFSDYDIYSISNSTLISKTIIREDFIIYMSSMSVLCFVWEFMYCYFFLKENKNTMSESTISNESNLEVQKNHMNLKDYVYCILNSFVAIIVYVVVVFHMNSNGIAHYVIGCSEKTINIIYYFTLFFVTIISVIQKYIFGADYNILKNSHK